MDEKPINEENCESCNKIKSGLFTGVYCFYCLGCCSRLVRSAKGSKEQAKAMLGIILRNKPVFTREQIIKRVRDDS